MPVTTSRSQLEVAHTRFTDDTKGHTLNIALDSELYRHLQFRGAGGRSMYWFDIITWPGNLTIDGDMGTFQFSREQDMFGFFRGHHDLPPGHSTIDLRYWAEKLRANSGDDVMAYSQQRFHQLLNERVADLTSYLDAPGLAEAVHRDILSSGDLSDERCARDLLDDFKFTADDNTTVVFLDNWEWDFREYTPRFMWNCHAIRWGIAQYDAAKEA